MSVQVRVPQESGDITITIADEVYDFTMKNHLVEAEDERERALLLANVPGAGDPSPQQKAAKTRQRRASTSSPAEPPADTAGGEDTDAPGAPADPQE